MASGDALGRLGFGCCDAVVFPDGEGPAGAEQALQLALAEQIAQGAQMHVGADAEVYAGLALQPAHPKIAAAPPCLSGLAGMINVVLDGGLHDVIIAQLFYIRTVVGNPPDDPRDEPGALAWSGSWPSRLLNNAWWTTPDGRRLVDDA